MDAWLTRPAADQGRALARGETDARALTEAYLDAIAAHPDTPRIYTETTDARAKSEAAAAAGRLGAGQAAGPLDGVPISWKDLYDVAGYGCEGGTKLLAGRKAKADATVVARGTTAGTICLGKTHTTEVAFSGLGVNPMTATPPNAIEPARAPGGSSSGAAVSTKMGLAALGIGSDTGGSVRIPAAWNDLVGLKTTAGLIPLNGVISLSPTYDTVGPLTRTVEDAALMFSILANAPVPDWSNGSLADETLQLAETVVLDGCEPAVIDAVEDVLATLSAKGMAISRGPVPEFDALYGAIGDVGAIVPSEAWTMWGETIEANPDTMWPPIEARFRMGQGVPAAQDNAALMAFAKTAQAVHARMADQGLIICPTAPMRPPEAQRLIDDADYFAEKNMLGLRNTRIGNLLGLSSITLPTRTPMCGLMIIAPPGSEARILSIAAAIETAIGAKP
ncbi:MAG: amidase family protein [Pseudomonadota bacterium]